MAGGLVGENSAGTIESCHSSMEVTGGKYTIVMGAGEYYIGGLVGSNAEGHLLKSFTCGAVSGEENVGGLVGTNPKGNIELCYSKASVAGKRYCGGLVGYNEEGNLSCCFSMGIVEGDVIIGGLAGFSNGQISNCQSYSVCSGNSCVGGLVGVDSVAGSFSVGEIQNCLSVGAVHGIFEAGGVIGDAGTGVISNSLWNVESTGVNFAWGNLPGSIINYGAFDHVVGMSTSELMDTSTYLSLGWDFIDEAGNGVNDDWQPSNNTYPVLRLLADAYPSEPNGLGTPSSPYIIETTDELQSVGYRPLAYYQLGTDLDCIKSSWTTAVIPWFGGHFDGNCLSLENLSIQGDCYLGLFGVLGPNSVLENLSLKNITVEGTGDFVAGLVAQNYGKILCCSSNGNVKAQNTVGGLVALNQGGISDAWCHVAVEGVSQVGGLAGDNTGTLTSCYSSGAVSGDEFVGGLLGGNEGSVTASFWDIDTSGQVQSAGGTGLPTTEMQDPNTFLNAGWDFVDETANGTDDIWTMPEGGYPRLWWEGDD